ncbi:MAG TPA: GNAT family N-acetyltransferase [Pedococcus sp.]|jgi:GNAT superfamily N-acetyltransferase|nr:GNAT family N-acetyltransferase [Pedococcus sp.]
MRIREAGPQEALVVAALTLQCARDRGGVSEPGFLDRHAKAWLEQRSSHPAWIAESGAQHAGLLQAAVLDDLPWPGHQGERGELVVQTLFVAREHRGHAIGERLLGAAVAWSRDSGLSAVSLSGRSHTRPMLERVGFAVVDDWFRVGL